MPTFPPCTFAVQPMLLILRAKRARRRADRLFLLLPELGRLHRDQLERPDRLVVFLPDAIHAEEHVAQWLQAPSSAGAGAGGSRGRGGHESGGAAEKREAQELYLLISVMGDGFLEEAH